MALACVTNIKVNAATNTTTASIFNTLTLTIIVKAATANTAVAVAAA